ncbi:MAG: HAD family hydrolase [Promethearchaeota archaeon]|jgi:HAD superfamily hydrolase (TIGR01549 family)
MLKGVFFDLFGTLMIYTDMQEAWEKWLQTLYDYFKDCGLKISQKLFASKCDGFLAKEEPEFKKLNLTIYEKRLYSLGIDLKLHLEIEDINEIANKTINAWQKFVPLDPDAISVLKVLEKNNILALITNFDHPPYVYSLLSELKLSKFFNSITISSEVGVKKPDPTIFSFALTETKLKINEVCYIGDSNEDIEAARSAKIYPILIQRKINTKNEIVDDYNAKEPSLNRYRSDVVDKNVKKIKSLKELINIVN